MVWKAVAAGQVLSRKPHAEGEPGGGGSLYVPFTLKPGGERTIRVLLAWYVPSSVVRAGTDLAAAAVPACGSGCACGDKPAAPAGYRPWYAGRFPTIAAVTR